VHFSPFEINLGKSEIIRALNSSIKVKIYVFLKKLINSRHFFEANHYLRSLCYFFLTLINIRPSFGYIRASEKIFGQIVSPLKLILSLMAMFYELFQQF